MCKYKTLDPFIRNRPAAVPGGQQKSLQINHRLYCKQEGILFVLLIFFLVLFLKESAQESFFLFRLVC